MLNKKIEKMLVEQMNFEIQSAYLYLAMGAYCDAIDMPGFANWYKVQWEEEIYHSTKMYDFIVDRGGRPVMDAIPAPKKKWEGMLDVLDSSFKHEVQVTSKINAIVTAAYEEQDHATKSFLNWYLDEQVEEESTLDTMIKQFKMVKDSGHGLYLMDKEMATRRFNPAKP